MTTFTLRCAKCEKPTPHRVAPSEGEPRGDRYQAMQCEVCGTIASVPPGGHSEKQRQPAGAPLDADLTVDPAALLAKLPTMPPRDARARLEELLYEHREAIEGSDAFCEAVLSANACNCEMQDIKVQSFDREHDTVIIEFTYYALGDEQDELSDNDVKISGSGVGAVDNQGNVEIREVTAAVAST